MSLHDLRHIALAPERPDVVLCELLLDLVQALPLAGDEDEIVVAAGQMERDGLADTARRTGDDSDLMRMGRVVQETVVFLLFMAVLESLFDSVVRRVGSGRLGLVLLLA